MSLNFFPSWPLFEYFPVVFASFLKLGVLIYLQCLRLIHIFVVGQSIATAQADGWSDPCFDFK